KRGLLGASRPISDGLDMLPLLVERREQVLPGHLLALALPGAELLIRRVGGDAIQPASERRLALERLDPPGRRPQGVLNDLLGVLLVSSDADGEPVDSIAIGPHEGLGSAGLLSSQHLHQSRIPIDAQGRGGRDPVGWLRLLQCRGTHISLPLASSSASTDVGSARLVAYSVRCRTRCSTHCSITLISLLTLVSKMAPSRAATMNCAIPAGSQSGRT